MVEQKSTSEFQWNAVIQLEMSNFLDICVARRVFNQPVFASKFPSVR